MNTYEVKSPGGSIRTIRAENSTDAKRKFCRVMGRKPGDPWVGLSSLTAKKIK